MKVVKISGPGQISVPVLIGANQTFIHAPSFRESGLIIRLTGSTNSLMRI